ncbi:MAG TPA: efflux RND transporter permease subunit [Candidatus Binataceae bacterium]|nr:efflux RND transporter permease subunit [Candidatus Binataceae bacterium]
MRRVNSTLAVLCVLALSALGVILAFSIPSSVFPEITFDRAIILADSGDLPPEQMLVSVTRPLEEAAYGVVGVSMVRSTTTRGSSEIDVTFDPSANATTAYQLLNAALSEVRARLPAGTDINTRLLTTGTFPIVDVSMSSQGRSLADLTDIALYDVVPSFHRISGVYRVEVVGGKYREFVVRLDPARMLEHGLSPQEIVDGLAKANIVASAGRVLDSHRMLLTVVTTNVREAAELAALPVASAAGAPVRISDVGAVELGIREDYVRTASEHGPAVLVGISRQPAGNTVTIAAETRTIVATLRQRYPDVTFSFSYDQSALVTESFLSVRDAIVFGLVLAVLVVFAFTRSLASALVAAIVVPCTLAITFVVMKAAGLTFNMMTLGGLAAGIGLFIDDAIVMIEAIHRARSTGMATIDAVPAALGELSRALVASTMTVIVVFAPLVFLSGVTGVFFRSLAATLGAGLAISLALALYFTPALEMIVEPMRRKSRESGRLFDLLRDGYLWMLRPFIRFPALSLVLAAGAIAAAAVLYGNVGTDYLPALDEGEFVLDYITPPESTLHDTQAMLGRIQQILLATPEVAAFARRTGTQLGFQLSESNTGDFSVRLRANRSRGIDGIINSVRDRVLATVPGVQVDFSQMLQDLLGDLSGTPQPIEVKVFGADQNQIEATAHRVAAELRKIPGLVDVFSGVVLSSPEEEVLVNESAAARYGLNAADVQTAMHAIIQGTVATNIRMGDRLVGVRVRYPEEFHLDIGALSEVLLKTPANGRVPLSAVTAFDFKGEKTEMNRERLRPVVHVTARLESVDLGTAMARVRATLAKLPLAPGITLEYGGLYAQQQQAFGELALVLVAGTVAMFLILVWEFGRLAPALGCLIAAVASLAGSFLGLDLTGITLNISSFMGIIMVAGITAKNGILLLDHAEYEVAHGLAPAEALVNAARIRMRPILMTTLATAAGLFPLALGLGAGAKVQQPLSIAVIGGLIFAMLLSTQLAGGIYLLGTRQRKLD